jgi:hypothetical protein
MWNNIAAIAGCSIIWASAPLGVSADSGTVTAAQLGFANLPSTLEKALADREHVLEALSKEGGGALKKEGKDAEDVGLSSTAVGAEANGVCAAGESLVQGLCQQWYCPNIVDCAGCLATKWCAWCDETHSCQVSTRTRSRPIS